MIKFKNILLQEEGGTQTIANSHLKEDAEKVVSFIKTHCSSAFANDNLPLIYRGISGKNPLAFLVNPAEISPRIGTSQDDGYEETEFQFNFGFHNLIISYSPLWKEFPSREKCIIGATTEYATKNYGAPYVLIPFDGAVFGVCPESDLWNTFENNTYDNFKSFLHELRRGNLNLTTSEMIVFLKSIPKRHRGNEKHMTDWDIQFLKFIESKHMTAWDFLMTQFPPEKIGKLKVLPYNKFGSIRGDHEVWTESPCILVEDNFYNRTVAPLLYN